jgi:phosphatidylserine/phosphatidylglycerophosphate/cardiolipin synthase-like enzyme
MLERIGRCSKLPVFAKIVDTHAAEIEIIHNKGFLIDRGQVLVSSINGTRNSVMKNREVGLILDSPDAARYYGDAFDFDWQVSPEIKGDPCNLALFEESLPPGQVLSHFQ